MIIDAIDANMEKCERCGKERHLNDGLCKMCDEIVYAEDENNSPVVFYNL